MKTHTYVIREREGLKLTPAYLAKVELSPPKTILSEFRGYNILEKITFSRIL